MKWLEYTSLFESILGSDNNTAPYDNPEYVNYVKMNQSRSNRWLKSDILSDELIKKIEAINEPQDWIIITEPWCGDAAHNVPVIAMLSEKNPLINFKVELRDNGENMIDSYLTNGGKSIPKLIIRNGKGDDLFTWGPRPQECQYVMIQCQKEGLPLLEKHKQIQTWYSKDKGTTIQKELMKLLS